MYYMVRVTRLMPIDTIYCPPHVHLGCSSSRSRFICMHAHAYQTAPPPASHMRACTRNDDIKRTAAMSATVSAVIAEILAAAARASAAAAHYNAVVQYAADKARNSLLLAFSSHLPILSSAVVDTIAVLLCNKGIALSCATQDTVAAGLYNGSGLQLLLEQQLLATSATLTVHTELSEAVHHTMVAHCTLAHSCTADKVTTVVYSYIAVCAGWCYHDTFSSSCSSEKRLTAI
eukprot:10765-Heterococcus_DN1.PRE.4